MLPFGNSCTCFELVNYWHSSGITKDSSCALYLALGYFLSPCWSKSRSKKYLEYGILSILIVFRQWKIEIWLYLCWLKSKHRKRLWTANSKTTFNKANTKNIVKIWKAVATLEMYWNSIAIVKASTWLRLEMMLNKFSSNFIITPWKCPLKLPISAYHCSMWTGIIPQNEQPSGMNSLMIMMLTVKKYIFINYIWKIWFLVW